MAYAEHPATGSTKQGTMRLLLRCLPVNVVSMLSAHTSSHSPVLLWRCSAYNGPASILTTTQRCHVRMCMSGCGLLTRGCSPRVVRRVCVYYCRGTQTACLTNHHQRCHVRMRMSGCGLLTGGCSPRVVRRVCLLLPGHANSLFAWGVYVCLLLQDLT
jgi:hypothetical protein